MKKALQAFAIVASASMTSAPAESHDNSRYITNEAYYNLQSYAVSSSYEQLYSWAVRNGYKNSANLGKTRIFLDAIKSGQFNSNFKAQVNLTTCAGIAMVNLTKEMNLEPYHHFFIKAFQTVDKMDSATKFKSRQIQCASVFYHYNLR